MLPVRFVVYFSGILMMKIMIHDDHHHHYVHSFSFVSLLQQQHHQRRYYNSMPYKRIIINNYLYNKNQHVQTYNNNNNNNKNNIIAGTTTTGTTWYYTLYMSSTSNDENSNDSNNTDTNDNSTEAIPTTMNDTKENVDVIKDDDDTIGIINQTQQDAVDTSTTTTSDSTSHTETNRMKLLHENWSFIQSIGAITGRGEFMLSTKYSKKTQVQYLAIEKVIQEIENMNPIVQPTLLSSSNIISGTWELVYSTTYLFRQSPFFLAGRAVCTNPNEIDQYNWFCTMHRNALSISQIQSVRQIINLNTNQLISEFEVNVGAIPFVSDFTPFRYSGGYPISITGAIISTADITPTLNGTAYEIYMDTVQIKGSNIPLLRNVLDNDNIKLQSRVVSNILQQQQKSNYNPPKPIFRITYLDEQYRICRDIDDHIYVYVKTSNNTTPTDFTYITPDLGIGRLLEGFNDAIIKFLYLKYRMDINCRKNGG